MKNHTIIAVLLLLFASTVFAQEQQKQELPNPPLDVTPGWELQSSGVSAGLYTVFFKTKDTGFVGVGGPTPITLFTSNGGRTWDRYPQPVTAIKFIGNFGYGYGQRSYDSGYISITIDNGKTWNEYPTRGQTSGGFYFVTPSRGFGFLNSYGRIIKTLDGGHTWGQDTVYPGDISGFNAFDSLHIIASGHNYSFNTSHGPSQHVAIMVSTNGGDTWFNQTTVEANHNLLPSVVFDSLTVYFCGSNYGMYRSLNRGYSLIRFGNDFIPSDLVAPLKNLIITVGANGEIHRSDDTGATWIKQPSGVTGDLHSVFFLDSVNGWAVGDNGVILHTTTGGFPNGVPVQHQQPVELVVQPNPSALSVSLSYSLPTTQHVTIRMYDLAGHLISTPLLNVLQPPGLQTVPIPTQMLVTGNYLLRFESESYLSTVTVSVIH